MSSEDRADVETKVTALRESLKGDDLDAVKSGAESLADTLSRVGAAAYAASAAAGDESGGFDPTGQGGAGSGGAGSDESNGTGGPSGEAEGEETVEGEFKEV